MLGNRKTVLIVSLATVFLTVAGFLYLFILVNSVPKINTEQNGFVYDKANTQMFIEMPASKGWEEGGYHAKQYDVTLYNNTVNRVIDWSVTLTLPEDAKITDSWNITINENEDGSITIINTPDQGFNDHIDPKGNITFGFILFTKGDYQPENFVLKAKPEAKITDYPLLYLLFAIIFLLLIFLILNIAIALKEKQYQIRQEHDRKIIIQSMKTFTNFIDAKDAYTRGHSIRVAYYTRKIAKRIGFDVEDLDNIYYIALLHDVGKINIPDAILNKPGKLTKEEMDVIKTHTTNGATILKDFSSIPSIVEGARYHHERYDGTGYPEGLAGHKIPLVARIICVADSFDAMNSDRCYRKAFSTEKIVNELREGSGKQFDPEIVKVMLELIEKNAFKNVYSELNDETF
ncbi:MAG: HD domain-containing protein [Lachnospiraceae bacterium]|nr:HD domain-containing protein [Lachnospiraceae bacterium]